MENKNNIVEYEIHTLDNMIGRLIFSYCEKDGLTKMQSWIIGYLYERRTEDVFQKDIEASFHIARSTATSILQLMEKRGFINREPVSRDARLKRLVLTEKGISHQINVISTRDHLEHILKEGIPPEELQVFIGTIHKMKRNIEKYHTKGDSLC